MYSHLTQIVVKTHAADLHDEARRARLARAARETGRRPSRVRTSAARLLVAVATRLDDRLRPTAAHAAPSAAGN